MRSRLCDYSLPLTQTLGVTWGAKGGRESNEKKIAGCGVAHNLSYNAA